MKKKVKGKVVILGGGLTGLSAAYHLEEIRREKTVDYVVVEKEKTSGGLCRSFTSNGFTFDIGGHFLHTKNSYVKGLIKKLLFGNIMRVIRKSEILKDDIRMPYPFQCNLSYLPDNIKFECLEEYIKAYADKDKNSKDINTNFKKWINFNFGKGIAKYFMIPFNSKLYGYPLDDIHAENMKKYIPLPNLKEVLDGALFKKSKMYGYNAVFVYPQKGGIQSLADAFENRVGSIMKGEEAFKIDTKRKKVYLKSGECISYDSIISSIPLKELVMLLDGVPEAIRKESEKLKCASLVIVNVGYKAQKKIKTQWYYLPDREYSCYRAGFYSAVSPSMAPPKMNSVYVEFSLGEGKNRITTSAYEKKAIESLKRMNVVLDENDIIVCNGIPVKYGYVIFDRFRDSAVNKISGYLEKNNIHACGRYGNWEYSAMTDAINAGKEIAGKI